MQRIIVSGILSKDGRVLIAKRSSTKKIAPGKWHLPGGHIEFGEVPEAALKREFHEEFRVLVKPQYVVRTFSYIWGDTHEIGISFAVEPAVGLPDNLYFDATDNERLAWIVEADIGSYFAPDDHDFMNLTVFFRSLASGNY